MNRRIFITGLAAVAGSVTFKGPLSADAADTAPEFTFPSIDGGILKTSDWRGSPVLVVNTASLCGFAGQLKGMQSLHEAYGARGLVVVAIPSDDFAQELDDAKKVKEYCTVTYGITLPMTDVTHVRGKKAHPFYQWLQQTEGFVPSWNFNKVLLDPQGKVVGTWGSATGPESAPIRSAFEPLLAKG